VEALGLNYADWFILVVLVASGIISFSRGFTTEFLSLFLWIAAFIAAISLEYLATPQINELYKIKMYQKLFLI
jgi:membrane protein required for colicin V production